MAITAYVGIPGSGKSYGVVENVIIPSCDEGRTVFTNIPINKDARESLKHVIQFDTKDIEENPNWFKEVFRPGAIFVFDEVWRLWPSGMRATAMVESHKSFLAEHRHMAGEDGRSTDIVLINQDLGNIASYPRSLIETTYRAEKLTAIGQHNRYRIDVYRGAVTGQTPPQKLRVRQMFGKYKPEIYACYTSQTMSETGAHGAEDRIDGRASLLNSPAIKFGMPAAVVGFFVMIWLVTKTWSSFFGEHEKDPEIAEAPETVGAQAETLSPPPVADLAPKESPLAAYSPYISFNMGRTPNIIMRITFVNGDNIFTLGESDLYRAGYKLLKVDQCLAYLDGFGVKQAITCLHPSEKKTGFNFDL